MKSIRRGLTLSLLSGLAILWLVAGVGIYVAVHHGLIKSLDAELALHARLVRFAARGSEESQDNRAGARRLQDRIPEYDAEDGDAFYQIWDSKGESQGKSISMGKEKFPFPGETIDSTPVFETVILESGKEIRTMRFRSVTGGGKGKGRRGNSTVTLLGLDTAPVRETLRSVLTGIAIVGVALGVMGLFLVRFGVAIGLKPLAELAQHTKELDAHSLDARLNTENVPAELEPVYAQLNHLIERLETSFDRERRFNSDLAHELRTPVAELRMMNEVALKWEDQAGEPTHRETLAVCHQLESTIETLLTLTRCESGELKPEIQSLSLEEAARKCWNFFHRKAEEKGLRVEFDFPETSPRFEADPDLLSPILNNLFSNAVEYAPEGDLLEIAQQNGSFVITNTAPDLEPADLEQLFDRYWRSDAARTDSGHVGLGLSLAQACAKVSGLHLCASLEKSRLTITLAPAGAAETD